MSNSIRNLKIFLLFSKYSIKSLLQERLGIVLFTLGKIIRFAMFFFFIYILVAKTSTLKGYTTNQVIIFYLSFNLVDTLSQLLFREVYRFRELVVTGELDGVLIKPYHPFLRVLVGGVDFLDAIFLGPYIALTVYFISISTGITLTSLFTYILLLMNALAITVGFHIAVLALGIVTTNVDHSIMIYRDVTSLGRFPIEIYREPLRWIFTFLLPVGIMMSFPSQSLFGLLSIQGIISAFVVSTGFITCSLFFWRYALRKYQSWGG